MSDKTISKATSSPADENRRKALKRLGRFAAATPPAVALLLAANSRPAKAQVIYNPDDTNDTN